MFFQNDFFPPNVTLPLVHVHIFNFVLNLQTTKMSAIDKYYLLGFLSNVKSKCAAAVLQEMSSDFFPNENYLGLNIDIWYSVGTNLVRFEVQFGLWEVQSSGIRDKAEVWKVRGSVLMDKP